MNLFMLGGSCGTGLKFFRKSASILLRQRIPNQGVSLVLQHAATSRRPVQCHLGDSDDDGVINGTIN